MHYNYNFYLKHLQLLFGALILDFKQFLTKSKYYLILAYDLRT